jgi:class 3 adenylate cyclase
MAIPLIARRSFRSGELLLVVLGLLERRPMGGEEVVAELETLLGDDYRLTGRGVAAALRALRAEGLVEPTAHGYRITQLGSEALSRRAGAEVLQRLGHRTEDVTVLFTDVVGSTELFDRLGDDAAHELRRRHFALLREAIHEQGGREVKSLGDGLMVIFDTAAAAKACANAMQRAVGACEDCLELRIGIASGEAVREGDDYFGRPVVTAKRLCDTARGGEVLVAGEPDAELEPVGPLALKGLSEPVAAGALRSRPLALIA